MSSFSEEIYNTNLPIHYVLEEAKFNKEYLVVVFSGFNSPSAPIQHSYNYMRTLKNLDCNKMFILDSYGPRGCYYIGEDLNFEVETSVISLIVFIARKLNIGFDKIIAVGSSKGGSAALYFGLKYSFGYIISGAPQVAIADYIIQVTQETASYMLGSEHKSESREKLNSLVYKQLDKKIYSKIFIFSSQNDWQYDRHVKPLLNEMSNRGIDFKATIDNTMKSHGDIGKFFPDYLVKTLLRIMHGFILKSFYIEKIENSKIKLKLNYNKLFEDIRVKCIIKNQGKVVRKYNVDQNEFVFEPEQPGVYEVYIELFNHFRKIYELFIRKEIIGKDKYDLVGIDFKVLERRISFTLLIEEYEELDFAYYIIKDKGIIEKIWYSKNKSLTYEISEPGDYQVMYFIRTQDGIKFIEKSHVIKVH